MKRAVITKYNQLNEKLTSYVAIMNYRFMNLCVKAEEVSLLSVKVDIEGEENAIEDVADVVKKNDYQFMIIPKYEDDLLEVSKGFTLAHPEFKQKVEKLEVEIPGDDGEPTASKLPYILLTMPDVDDDRYDVLNDAVKLAYDKCKTDMDVANQKSQVELAPLRVGESKEDIERLDDALDRLNKEKNELRDKLKKEKLEEIEEAHNRWLAKKKVEDQKRQEEEAARGKDVISKMKMGQKDE